MLRERLLADCLLENLEYELTADLVPVCGGLYCNSLQDPPGVFLPPHPDPSTAAFEAEGVVPTQVITERRANMGRNSASGTIHGPFHVSIGKFTEKSPIHRDEHLPLGEFRAKLSNCFVLLSVGCLKVGLGLLDGREVGSEAFDFRLKSLRGKELLDPSPNSLESTEEVEGHAAQGTRKGTGHA